MSGRKVEMRGELRPPRGWRKGKCGKDVLMTNTRHKEPKVVFASPYYLRKLHRFLKRLIYMKPPARRPYWNSDRDKIIVLGIDYAREPDNIGGQSE